MKGAPPAFRCLFVPVSGIDCDHDDVTTHLQWLNDQWNARSVDCKQYCMTIQAYFDSNNCNVAVGRPIDESRQSCSSDRNTLWDEQCRCIRQYIKPQDQYMSLVSLLLKSRAFYHSLTESDDYIPDDIVASNASLVRPIIVLPRSRYNQPFIPVPQSATALTDDPVTSETQVPVPFSISHQYPIVGMLQKLSSSEPSLYCGLDIVIFDPYNPSLYASTMDFIAVFQDLFSRQEWNCIMQCHRDDKKDIFDATATPSTTTSYDYLLLREFYIRWSMKEAYTKAFGMGMNFNFASFETVRILPDVPSQSERKGATTDTQNIRSLYRWIESCCITACERTQQPKKPVCAIGTVTQLSSESTSDVPSLALQRPKEEKFWFFFYPFHKQNSDSSSTAMNTMERIQTEKINTCNALTGCACMCVGPVVPSDDALDDRNRSHPVMNVEWTSLHLLCKFHLS